MQRRRFKIPPIRFEERRRISVNGRPNHRNKAAFWNSSRVVLAWTWCEAVRRKRKKNLWSHNIGLTCCLVTPWLLLPGDSMAPVAWWPQTAPGPQWSNLRRALSFQNVFSCFCICFIFTQSQISRTVVEALSRSRIFVSIVWFSTSSSETTSSWDCATAD